MTEQIRGVYRAPFNDTVTKRLDFTPGLTVSEMVALACLPSDFREYGTVLVGGHEIPQELWGRIKPKAGHNVTFHYFPFRGGGGSGSGTKAILSVVLAVATVLSAGLVTAFGVPALGIAAGSWQASLLATGISIAGSMASSMLSAAPVAQPDTNNGQTSRGAAALSGNVLAQGSAVPRVVGTRWIYPPLACQPLVYRDGPDEYVEGVFILDGPHHLGDIRLGDAFVEDAEDVEIQTREGWPDDPAITLVQRYGATSDVRVELSTFAVEGNDYQTLLNQSNPSQSMPKWATFGSSAGCDEIQIQLSFPGGLYHQQENDQSQAVPIRLRMTPTNGGATINLPELHIASETIAERRCTVTLRWGDPPSGTPSITHAGGFDIAYKRAPGQSISPATSAWVAHSSFSGGAGNDALYRGNEGVSNVRRVRFTEWEAVIYLDEAQIPKVSYQIEMKRGFCYRLGAINKANYNYDGGGPVDFFHYYNNAGKAMVRRAQRNISAMLYLQRSVSIFNRHPIGDGMAGSGFAVVAVRALNREIRNVSVEASGYVRDWDGNGWSNWVYGGQYLAAHFRDVLCGDQTSVPLDEDLIDEASLLDWRDRCIANGYSCDLICEEAGILEVLGKIAGCGYARPYSSEVWGVIQDYDRSGEDPVVVFSSRNSSGLSMAKAFANIPDSYRVSYRSASDLDHTREILVNRPGGAGLDGTRLEAIEYQGLKTESAVVRRAQYDLLNEELRSTIWSFRAPLEAIPLQRGDLFAVNHDVVDKTHGSARIIDVYVEIGNVTGVELDSAVPVYVEPDMHAVVDMHSVADMRRLGLKSEIMIRQSNSMESIHAVSGATGSRSTVMFETPVPVEIDPVDGLSTIRADNLVKIGEAGKLTMRLIAIGITYDRDNFASIEAVPEAPEIWQRLAA